MLAHLQLTHPRYVIADGDQVRMIGANLKKNAELRDDVIAGTTTPQMLAVAVAADLRTSQQIADQNASSEEYTRRMTKAAVPTPPHQGQVFEDWTHRSPSATKGPSGTPGVPDLSAQYEHQPYFAPTSHQYSHHYGSNQYGSNLDESSNLNESSGLRESEPSPVEPSPVDDPTHDEPTSGKEAVIQAIEQVSAYSCSDGPSLGRVSAA